MNCFNNIKANEVIDIIAVIALSIALFLAIAFEQKDLTLLLGGALGGVIGVTSKTSR